MANDAVGERLTQLERQVEELQRELAAMRTRFGPRPMSETAEAAVADARVEAPAPTPPPPPPPAPSAPPASPLAEAWRAFERGDPSYALGKAFEAARLARSTGDGALLAEVAAFADAAFATIDDRLRFRLDQLVSFIDEAEATTETRAEPGPPRQVPAVSPAPPRPSPWPPVREPPAREPPPPREPGYVERAVEWARAELTGARAFAVVGGAVILLGVIFLFVLAANRGLFGPRERVALGAAVSLALVGIGIALRVRYDRIHAALGAVGAGIAGAYATLAAATILYSYLPSWGALLGAAGIAAVGGGIAVAWSSQIVAGLALVGAAAAPGLVALDDQISWPGPAFALVVFAATIAVAAPRRWLWLADVVAAVVVVQLVWLAAAAPLDDSGAVVVTCIGSIVFLAAAIAWQAYGGAWLEGSAASFALVAGLVALWSPLALVSEDRDTGFVLIGLALAFLVIALAVGRRLGDLAWTIGAEALMLGGVAAAYLASGTSLTVVWAIEAAVLAALAWKLGMPRFEAGALVYLAAAIVHALAIEILPHWPEDAFDVPRGAAPGLFVLATASLASGLLLPQARADRRSEGLMAALEPMWDGLVRARIGLRATLAVGAVVIVGAATAALLSGRWLTILWALLAAVFGTSAFALGERRLQPFGLALLAAAAGHALVVDAQLETLALGRQHDPLGPVASLGALAVAAAALAAFARFETRGIPWLGPLAGPERHLNGLRRGQDQVRATLAFAAALATTWALGLVAIELSYEPGQVVATALWALLGTAVVTLGARARSVSWQLVGGTIVVGAFVKSAAFDWDELGDGPATVSLLVAASAILLAGFLCRWENPAATGRVEIASLAAGAVAAVAAIVALERVLDIDSRGLGLATLGVVAVLALAGLPPYLRWRATQEDSWPRGLANGYWALALVALLFAENTLVSHGEAGTMAAWGGTAAVLALAWKPLAEERVWLAALVLTVIVVVGSVTLVTVPSRLVDASAHPASGVWALVVVIVAAWSVALTAPERFRPWQQWVLGGAAALTLYGVSLGVLDLAERVSGSSVNTDFQRGHTAVSALWGVGALALYVIGLARDRRDLRVVGLTLFGLALAKLFLYDLSKLSSITRAFSFLAVGAILLTAGFFAERLVKLRVDVPPGPTGPTPT